MKRLGAEMPQMGRVLPRRDVRVVRSLNDDFPAMSANSVDLFHGFRDRLNVFDDVDDANEIKRVVGKGVGKLIEIMNDVYPSQRDNIQTDTPGPLMIATTNIENVQTQWNASNHQSRLEGSKRNSTEFSPEKRRTLLPLFDDNHFIHFVPGADCINHFHILSPTEYRMDTIQMGLRRMADEELAPAGVSAAMRHRERAGQILIGIDLTIDRITRTTGAISLGTSSLDDKIWDDTMKLEPVIEIRTPPDAQNLPRYSARRLSKKSM